MIIFFVVFPTKRTATKSSTSDLTDFSLMLLYKKKRVVFLLLNMNTNESGELFYIIVSYWLKAKVYVKFNLFVCTLQEVVPGSHNDVIFVDNQ